MIKKYKFLALLGILLFGQAHAQQVPNELKGVFPKKGGASKEIRSLRLATETERQFITNGTEMNPEGYLIVQVPLNYLDHLRKLDTARHIDFSKKINKRSIMGMAALGEVRETSKRSAYFFGDRSGAGAMVTVWKYKEDGAAVVAIQEFTNQSFDGMNGTLSLATNPDSEICLWKMTVSNDEEMFEVTIEDVMRNGRAKMPVAKITAEMRKIIAEVRDSE